MKSPEVRRARLRPMRLAYPGDTPSRGAFDPPLLSLSPTALRRVLANHERWSRPLVSVREELWFRDGSQQIRAALVAEDRLELVALREGEAPIERRLVRIPIGPDKDHGGLLGRWEYGRDRAVLSTKGAGLITAERVEITVDVPPIRLDVHRGEDGVLIALRNVPNGAVLEHTEGLQGLPPETLLSDIRVPDLERGPSVEVHPLEAFLCGFAALGFKADFGGLDFAGFARAQGEGSRDLARFTRKSRGVAWAAITSVERPEAEDSTLASALAQDLRPRDTIGRCRLGKPGTITLSDGRRYRVCAASVERLPRGRPELIVAGLLTADAESEHALLVRVGAPVEAFEQTPSADVVLARLRDFLVGVMPWPSER